MHMSVIRLRLSTHKSAICFLPSFRYLFRYLLSYRPTPFPFSPVMTVLVTFLCSLKLRIISLGCP